MSAKEHFSGFCCQEIVPGLWTAAKDAPAPSRVEVFFQKVAAGSQDLVLSLDVLIHLGRAA